jgi:hypothetical protein
MGMTDSLMNSNEVLKTPAIPPIRIIAMILAHGVLRLQARQKALDTRTEQRVHDPVLNPKGDTE